MFVFKNALKNLWRNKGRNIMLAIIIFVIIAATVVSLAINNTAAAIINDYKDRFASEVVIMPDINKMLEGGERPAAITVEEYELYATSLEEYLSRVDASGSANCTADGFTPVEQSSSSSRPGFNGTNTDVTLIGGDYSVSDSVYADFYSEERGLLTSGTYEGSTLPYNEGDIIVSKELFDLNGWTLGSTISMTVDLSQMNFFPGQNSTEETEEITYNYENLKIVGVFYDLTEEHNEIMTNFDTVAAALDTEGAGTNMNLNISVTFYLKDPADLEAFAAGLYALGLSTDYTVSTDSATYDQIVKPVLSLKNISLIFMIVVLILGGIIITVLASIAIRERKFEIGTLRAIGMKKSKISLGLLTEMLAITIVCLIFGFLVGYFVSQPVSDVLLAQQVEASSTESFPGGGMGNFDQLPTGGSRPSGGGGNFGAFNSARVGTTPLSEMKISFNFITILEVFGIALILAAIPTVAAVIKITKYEPMKILADRN